MILFRNLLQWWYERTTQHLSRLEAMRRIVPKGHDRTERLQRRFERRLAERAAASTD
jgi:hypothetical protein